MNKSILFFLLFFPLSLFSQNIDPSEKFNVAKKNPEKVQEILNLIESHNSKLMR